MSCPSRITLLLFLQLFSLSYAQTCYDRDGNTLNTAAYLPCDNATAFSSCCLLDTGNSGPGDICTSAGLCLRQNMIPGFLYIDGCTDKSWADPSCPSFCSNSSESVVQACNDVGVGTWCCRASDAPSCCDSAFTTNVGVLLIPSQTTHTVSATQSIATAPASTTIGTTAVTEKPAASTTCAAATKDKSAVIGGSVGAVLGVALLASLGTLFWREKTRPKPDTNKPFVSSDRGLYQGFDQVKANGPEPYEMTGSRDIQELHGNGR